MQTQVPAFAFTPFIYFLAEAPGEYLMRAGLSCSDNPALLTFPA